MGRSVWDGPDVGVCSELWDSAPNPTEALSMVDSNIPAFHEGQQTPSTALLLLGHNHPKKHLEEEGSQPANRQEGTSVSEQVEEQKRGADGQFLTLKEGAAPTGRAPETRTNTSSPCRVLSQPLPFVPFLSIRGFLSEM